MYIVSKGSRNNNDNRRDFLRNNFIDTSHAAFKSSSCSSCRVVAVLLTISYQGTTIFLIYCFTDITYYWCFSFSILLLPALSLPCYCNCKIVTL